VVIPPSNLNQRAPKVHGFTLIELLVVIAIIGVLATLLLLQLGVARQRARDAKRIADVNQVRTATELYFDDNVPVKQLAQRFRLKACTLYRWIAKLDKVAPDLTVAPAQPKRHKKLHARAKDFIIDYLEDTKVPIRVPALKQAIK